MLYKRYVAKKNEKVTDLVDEDPELNIADKYLSKLANYSVFYDHFNPITRRKARLYGQRMGSVQAVGKRPAARVPDSQSAFR